MRNGGECPRPIAAACGRAGGPAPKMGTPLPCVRTGDGKDKNRTVSFEVAVLEIYPLLIYGRSCIVPLSTSRVFHDPRPFLCSSHERKADALEWTEAFEEPRTESELKLDLGANHPDHVCSGAGPHAIKTIPNFNLRTRAAMLVQFATS